MYLLLNIIMIEEKNRLINSSEMVFNFYQNF